MKYRSRTDIVINILETTRSGAGKTKIMFDGYLSYRQTLAYIKFLKEADLLTCEEGTKLYRVTEKGLKFLSRSHELNELMVKNLWFPMTMIDGKKAKEIATKFLEQYNTVTDTKVVLKGNTWTVVVASGFENKKLKQVKIDAETGKILGYIPIN